MSHSCVFCKIVSGEIPSMTVYEDEATLAFMDIAGDADGHLLVIPKRHYDSLFDCDGESFSRVMATVKRVSATLVTSGGYDGVNFLNASGEAAGQSVGHFHVHLLPRKANDGLDAWPRLPGATKPIADSYHLIKESFQKD